MPSARVDGSKPPSLLEPAEKPEGKKKSLLGSLLLDELGADLLVDDLGPPGIVNVNPAAAAESKADPEVKSPSLPLQPSSSAADVEV